MFHNELYGQGSKFPCIFELEKKFSESTPKIASLNKRFRIQYLTDAVNDYFDRDSDPGEFKLYLNEVPYNDFSCNLWNGIATLNVVLPEDNQIGDSLIFRSEVIDVSRWESFNEEFYVVIGKESKNGKGNGKRRKPRSNRNGNGEKKEDQLALPEMIQVYRNEWERHSFNENSALKVEDSGDDGYDFYINMDNIHLLTEKKDDQKTDCKLLDARYKYGMTLIGLAFLNNQIIDREKEEDKMEENGNVYQLIKDVTSIISPMLLPMISELGDLEIEEGNVVVDSAESV